MPAQLPTRRSLSAWPIPCPYQAFAEEVTNLQKQDAAPEQLVEKLVQVQAQGPCAGWLLNAEGVN